MNSEDTLAGMRERIQQTEWTSLCPTLKKAFNDSLGESSLVVQSSE